MSNNVKNEMINKINNLYSQSGYMDKYGSDVWAAVIICIVFLLITNYYIFTNALEVIKADWSNQKCNPMILPFAGFINKPTDQSNLEFTTANFNGCINSLLTEVLKAAIQPLYYVINILQDTCNGLVDAFQELRKLTKNLRYQVSNIFSGLFAGITNLMVSVITFVVKMKDTMAKINGVLTTSLYTLFGSYMAAESMFLSIINLILIILITLACAIVLFWSLAMGLRFIPIVGMALAIPMGTTSWIFQLVFISILIPTIWFEVMMLRIMNLSTPSPPGVPGCFSGNTLIELFIEDNNSVVPMVTIKDIQIGDQLKNGSIVTAIIKSAAEEQNVYLLNNVFVTGEHRVYHPTLKWIKVKNHPDSIYLPDFDESYVYCLGTTSKTFTIGNTLFSDWDDIDDEVLEDLRANCSNNLPKNFTLADIHIHLDSGFDADSSVVLQNGCEIAIKDVNVNDVLLSGDKVAGLIKIAAHDIKQYTYSFANNSKTIRGTQNIHIHDENLGIIHGMEYIERNKQHCTLIQDKDNENKYMYHLLTDTKHFVINNIRVNDYNYGIDNYLRP